MQNRLAFATLFWKEVNRLAGKWELAKKGTKFPAAGQFFFMHLKSGGGPFQ